MHPKTSSLRIKKPPSKLEDKPMTEKQEEQDNPEVEWPLRERVIDNICLKDTLTKDTTEVKEEENDTPSKVEIVVMETKSLGEVKEEILASMDVKNSLVEKAVDKNKEELTDVGNKPVGNVNIESEGGKVEKEGNIAKLNEISKEVDEGHQDLRRSK